MLDKPDLNLDFKGQFLLPCREKWAEETFLVKIFGLGFIKETVTMLFFALLTAFFSYNRTKVKRLLTSWLEFLSSAYFSR